MNIIRTIGYQIISTLNFLHDRNLAHGKYFSITSRMYAEIFLFLTKISSSIPFDNARFSRHHFVFSLPTDAHNIIHLCTLLINMHRWALPLKSVQGRCKSPPLVIFQWFENANFSTFKNILSSRPIAMKTLYILYTQQAVTIK